jgi:hypothetical protein
MDFFRTFFTFCLVLQALSVPVPLTNDDFCTNVDATLKYETGRSYIYKYETDTALFINDISDEAKSTLKLKTNVAITAHGGCTYGFQLSGTSLTGESIDEGTSSLEQLNLPAQFNLNSQGELDSAISFDSTDQAWSKNIKRAIVSAFQIKSFKELRSADGTDEKSGVFYENDVLGRCRTTYNVDADEYDSAGNYKLEKTKSLQRCTLVTGQKGKSSGGQYVPYKQIPEFFDGRLFIEDYKCESHIKENLVNSVVCREVSTFKIGSRGIYGAQAIVNTRLEFVNSESSSSSANGLLVAEKINFEYYNSKQLTIETSNFEADKFVSDICQNVLDTGLANDHSVQFKDLMLTMKSFSVSQMTDFYTRSAAKCDLAGLTAAQAIVFANTDNSVEASLTLIDNDSFASQKYITEYPILTALARNAEPSAKLISKIKEFLETKASDFAYLNKLSLVYSTLVHTYCKNEGCTESELADYASVFTSALGTDCSDATKSQVVVAALKSVGNIGFFSDPAVLAKCARNKTNTVEVRVTAVQASRRFTCSNLEKTSVFYNLLEDTTDDTEVRITAFINMMRCSDNSELFAQFASTKLADFLLNEEDQQVLSFVIDYGKEHGLTSILNAALDDPRVRQKFSVNFKELSWNNYKYKYNVMRDGAVEVETSVIFTPKTWIPRSIYFNVTMHAFGASISAIEANLRLEGLDEVLKATLIDKLTSDKFMKRVMAEPEKLIEILQILSSKLNYAEEAAKVTLSFRVYGNDVFYSNIDSKENFMKLANFLKSPRQTILYRQVETIKNMLFIDTSIRQPLINGLSFVKYLDISASALLSKKSTKDQDEQLNFNVDNFWSISGSVTGTYEVNVNTEKKLSLKKKSFVNARVKAKVQGFKKEGHWQYNMDLSPMKQIPLITADGQFFKLGKNSAYKQVTEFKTQQKVYTRCNTEQFQTTFGGLALCLSVNRPDFGSLVKILRKRRQGDLEESFSEYYSDLEDDLDDDEVATATSNNDRPTLVLAGPYHYELVLNNPELIKTVILNAEFSRQMNQSDVTASLSTVSVSDEETKRIELVYSRLRQSTFRGVHGKVSIALTQVDTNDVRLRFNSEVEYQKLRVLKAHLEIENKIIRPFHHMISLGRDARDGHVVPKYHLEALMDTSRGPRRYNLHFDVTPAGSDITSNFHMERSSPSTGNQNVRYLDGKLSLTKSGDLYNVDFHAHNLIRQANLDITGTVMYGMFKSDIDLSIDYKNPRITLPEPATIKLGHNIDLSEGANSNIRAAVKHAYRSIDHSIVVTFAGNVAQRKINSVQIDLSRPGLEHPVTLFFEKVVTESETTHFKEIQLGVRNMQRDLTQSGSSLARTLIKVDFDNTLRSLVLHVKRTHVRGASINHELYVKKNDKAFVTVKDEVFGQLAKVRENFSELEKTAFGASLYVKILDNSGAVSAKLDLEASKVQKIHKAEFDFKTENLFKILSRVAGFNAKFVSTASEFNAEFEMKRLGEVKSFKVFSTSGLRRNGDSAEFDVGYEKRLANGKVLSSSGIGAFTFTNFKNFKTSVQVPGHYSHKLEASNSRDSSQNGLFANHNFQFENSHLDYEPLQNRFDLLIENSTQANGYRNMNFVIDARKGPVGQIANNNALDALGLISSKNIITPFGLIRTYNSLGLKSSRFNLNLEKSLNYNVDQETQITQLDTKTDLKVPAIITDPGKLNYVKHEMVITKAADSKLVTIMNRFNTDSKLFGRVFRVLNLDYKREMTDNTNVIDYELEYKLSKESKFISPLSGTEIDLSECKLSENIVRQKANSVYNLDYTFVHTCSGQLVGENKVSVKRSYDAEDRPSTRASFSGKSAVFPYPPFTVEVAHDKFHKSHGLVGLHINVAGNKLFSNEFSFDRTVDSSNKLKTAHYQTATSFGEQNSKSCSLDISNDVDYYNSLDCRLNSTKVPNMELNYGYKLKLANVAERAFGKRSGELNVVIPGRTMRIEYAGNYPAYFDGHDDDEDSNNEREFNASSTVYWNYVKDPTKFITVNAKRDNVAKGKSTTYIQFVNTPHFNLLKFSVDKTRSFNETNMVACAKYEMKSGATNCLTLDATLSSDMDTSSFALETNLERPSFNTRYENKFNKNNGRLQYLGIRVGKVLKLSIDKEYDPENRLIAIELTNPDESKYQFNGKSELANSVYTVEGNLSKNGQKLSNVVSKFNSKNNVFDVSINGLVTGNSYNFNFGLYDETLASAIATNTKTNQILGITTLNVVDSNGYNELIMTMRFNRFWRQLQVDILGGDDNALAKPADNYNSYFGDVYAEVTEELKPVVEAHRSQRAAIRSDVRNLVGILADFYSNFLGPERRREFQRKQMQMMATMMEKSLNGEPELPIYKKVLRSYNKIAKALTKISVGLRKHSNKLSKLVPRLPTYEYNQDENKSEFSNHLVISRPTLHAKNLYQFNHEYRDYVRKAGENFLAIKRNLVRSNLAGLGIRSLINKYKYRSLSEYTLVATVFNKRNIIGFDGESATLQSRCKYLLAHEVHRNRFSVVLNFEKNTEYPISVYAFGKSVDIGYKGAAVSEQAIALPRHVDLGENGVLSVTKTAVGVCVELNHDMQVCCHDDSKSCTVAASRWFTGKLDGLLGRADSNGKEIKQEDWFMDNSCSNPNAKTRLPTEEAVKACYQLFGRHRKAFFRNALNTVKPEAWRSVCESVLTANLKYNCAIMNAFVHHARLEKVMVSSADECLSCKLNVYDYGIGQNVASNAAGLSTNFAKGTDLVFVLLPCKSEPSQPERIAELTKIVNQFSANTENRFSFVKVEENDASIVQGANGETHNVFPMEVFQTAHTTQITKHAFNKAMIMAGSLLTQRLSKHRHLVFISCGNCRPYRLDSLKYIRKLQSRNVVVSSLGDYNIKEVDSLYESDERPVAYNSKNIYLYNDNAATMDSDYLDSYNIDHDVDMCSRLAIKTGGYVAMKDQKAMVEIAGLLWSTPATTYSYKVGQCQRYNTPYGDLTDFTYTRTQVSSYSDDY